MLGGAGSSVVVFIDGAVAPHPLGTKIQDVLCAIPQCSSVYNVINAGVTGVLQIVIDVHELLRTGSHRIGEEVFLIAPDHRLHPGVHGPGIVGTPCFIDTEGFCLIGKDASGVGVEIGHHGFYGGIGDFPGIIPFMALQ